MDSETTTTPVHRGLFTTVRERLAGRSDSEHIQALVRVAIGGVGLIYVFFIYASGKLSAGQHHMLFVASCFVLAAIGIFVSVIIQPQASPARRLVGMVLDFSATSYFMYVMEDLAILFFAVYLWVTIGNGLRYGTRYLFTAMTVAIISFALVIANSAYWRGQWGFSAGLLIGLIALPLYFSSLLKQLGKQHDELKRLYEQMARHATHDSLTNLPNRKHFHDQLAETIASAKHEKRTFTVLYLDLDGFKAINDDLGHAIGDQLIENTARRLEHCVRKGDMVARVGGDEFVVLLQDVASPDVSKIAEKIIDSLSKPLMLVDKTLSVTTSIGVATYPQDGENVNVLIHSADSAMYEAKRNGKNGYRIFSKKHTPFMPVSVNGLAG
ncbi:MAG: diguanylate cyclase domain-containing protein [Sulfuricaulis sp.]